MKLLLDTNICIHAIKGHTQVIAALRRHSPGNLRLSSITLAELWFGARKSRPPERNRALQDAFTEPFEILPFDEGAAAHYAGIRHHLEAQGKPIGERDQMIAAIALSNGCTLVTNNTREFSRITDLSLDDWL